ncbi:hypothetical protein Agub_g6515 [Astrephomene gubernaculifera]|uniref:Uncharacterized protein n=1 Tax=Astrephomene gubernaculifera TaxID=47775 RepID=A0AAD3DNH6_9CHLO|nr:hypothetical protein Agub_g6515 [Astrephomene gubernaculifera]
MNWMLPPGRVARRAHLRERLQGVLDFVDDDSELVRSAEQVYMNCGSSWLDEAQRHQEFELEAILATSTDAHEQSVENTVADNGTFWSSTGSDKCTTNDALLYRIRQPLGHVSYVSLAVYRALYQFGDPLYPPRKVSFLTGPTPNQLYPASPVYPVRLTDAHQVFAITPTAPFSQYLMVRLHGRMQRQREDMRFYIAIRHVGAYGTVLPPNHFTKILRNVPSKGLTWPCSRGLVTTSTSVQSTAAAAAAAAAAGSQRRQLLRSAASGAARDGEEEGEDMLAAEVYEAGPPAFRTAREIATSSSCSSSSRSPRWVDGRWCPRRKPKRPAETEPGTTALGWGLSYFRSSTAASTTAAATAVSKISAAQVVPRPTGPTDSELSRAVAQAPVARAAWQLSRVPWPEVLLVHGVHVADMQLAPPAARPAAAEPTAQERRQAPHAGAAAVPSVVPSVPAMHGSTGGNSSSSGGSSSAGGGGSALAAGPGPDVLAEVRREHMQHEQEWLRAAAAAASASTSAVAVAPGASPADADEFAAAAAAARSSQQQLPSAAESGRLVELLTAAVSRGGAVPPAWASMLASAAAPEAAEAAEGALHGGRRWPPVRMFDRMISAIFHRSAGGSDGPHAESHAAAAGGGSSSSAGGASVGGSAGEQRMSTGEYSRARAAVARDRARLAELTYLVFCIPYLTQHPHAQHWLKRLRGSVAAREQRLAVAERRGAVVAAARGGGSGAGGGAAAAGSSRTQQLWPPPQHGAADVAVGHQGEGLLLPPRARRHLQQQQRTRGGNKNESRRPRRALQAAQRAMQEGTYAPDGPLFLLFEAEGTAAEEREQRTATEGGGPMDVDGCGREGQAQDAETWLVSHYDNEHL